MESWRGEELEYWNRGMVEWWERFVRFPQPGAAGLHEGHRCSDAVCRAHPTAAAPPYHPSSAFGFPLPPPAALRLCVR
jgi:hypothetical protein